jgi:hypothetical protein
MAAPVLALHEVVLPLPGVAEHEQAVGLLVRRLDGEQPAARRHAGGMVERGEVEVAQAFQHLDVRVVQRSAQVRAPVLVRLVLEQRPAVERHSRLERVDRPRGPLGPACGGDPSVELLDVDPCRSGRVELVAVVPEQDVALTGRACLQMAAEGVDRDVEVVARRRRGGVGPEPLHEDFLGHGPSPMYDQVLEHRSGAPVRPRPQADPVPVHLQGAQAQDPEPGLSLAPARRPAGRRDHRSPPPLRRRHRDEGDQPLPQARLDLPVRLGLAPVRDAGEAEFRHGAEERGVDGLTDRRPLALESREHFREFVEAILVEQPKRSFQRWTHDIPPSRRHHRIPSAPQAAWPGRRTR